jgi:hypothetical protein
VLDSGDYTASLAELAHGRGAACKACSSARPQARAAGRLYGIGVAAIVEPSVSNMGYISTVLTAEQRAKAGPKNGAIASATVGHRPARRPERRRRFGAGGTGPHHRVRAGGGRRLRAAALSRWP